MKGCKKGLGNIYVALVVTGLLVFVTVMIVNNFNGKSTVKGSDSNSGVYFTYEGTEYQVYIARWPEKTTPGDSVVVMPDDEEYKLIEDREFISRYGVHDGYCDCFVLGRELGDEITVTMNLTGEPREYNFQLGKYEGIDEEILYILGEGIWGYALATNQL